jgi:probable rRNA maturation factor
MGQTAIDIAPEARAPRGALPKRELTRFVQEACAAIGLLGEVSILLTTNAAMQELNRVFRRKNKPTDVLSFPSTPLGIPGESALAGDLAVSLDIAAAQASELGHPLATEVRILLLHGLLHLAGFDHEHDSGQMARRERALRRKFDLPVGLIQRTTQKPEAAPRKASRSVAARAAKSKPAAPARRAARRKLATVKVANGKAVTRTIASGKVQPGKREEKAAAR